MTSRTLITRSLRFHWRAHLGVALGAAVGSAALIGALVVGDSVRGSLRTRALQRLGQIHFAINAGDRFFLSSLEERLPHFPAKIVADLGAPTNRLVFRSERDPVAAALLLPGTASTPAGSARANHVNVMGVNPATWGAMAGWKVFPTNVPSWKGEVADFVPEGPADAILSKLSEGHGNLEALEQSWSWSAEQAALAVKLSTQAKSWRLGESAFVNETLARELNVREGDDLILRLRQPNSLVRGVVIDPQSPTTITFRLKVGRVLPPERLADFNLTSGQVPAANAFLPLEFLAQKIGAPGRANLLLNGTLTVKPRMNWLEQKGVELCRSTQGWRPGWLHFHRAVVLEHAGLEEGFNKLQGNLWRHFTLEDAQIEVQITRTNQSSAGGEAASPFIEVTTPRIFLEAAMNWSVLMPGHGQRSMPEGIFTAVTNGVATNSIVTNGVGILTYLANLLRAGTNAAPYSMVTAAGPPWTPPDLRDDEIMVGQWLADDLRVKPGDLIELSYLLPESAASLIEATNPFRIRTIVPMEMPWADRTLMPDFPGIEKAESTRDWDAGFPLVHKIRQKDEEYWKEHRGTPKAFVTLAAGQKMWANRFGELTAIRFPVPMGTTAEEYHAAVEKKILATIKPEQTGLRFEPVRQQALQAAEQAQDFGQLFLGFSFFLIAAALLLMALLFQLGLAQRAPEIGTLLALGFTPKQVRTLWLGEGAALSLVGGILGTLGGMAYAWAMLHGLTTIWRDAVGATVLDFHMTGQTLAVGLCSAVFISVVTIWLTLRKFVRRAPRELLAGDVECGNLSPATSGQVPKRKGAGKSAHSKAGWLAFLFAVALGGWVVVKGDTANSGAFFGAGALLLLAGLSFAHAWLARLQAGRVVPSPPSTGAQETGRPALTLGSLGLRGCARRRNRSVATVAMLACGSFLIVSIGVFRLDANRDATKRSSGTGGFALIGETTMPVTQDLNSKSGRNFFALNESDLAGVNFLSFRVREGDEASCLNLNRAQKPRLLGVKPDILEGRFAFAKGAGWPSLRSSRREEARTVRSEIRNPKSEIETNPIATAAPDEIPAIGDANSIQWALGRKIGDTMDFMDERGQAFKLRLVGAVANSILQGSLIIDEAEFVKRFPGESGYRMFLIDAPSNTVSQVSAMLSRTMQDAGLELTPAPQRLGQFNAVQNTYLRTFQILGGLGLLLGSIGLGVVVLSNVLERRGELGLLLAVGFRAWAVQRLVLTEHAALLGLGLALGVAAAAVAVLPALLSPGERLPYASLALTLGAVLVNGALWTWLATRFALRGNLLEALRND